MMTLEGIYRYIINYIKIVLNYLQVHEIKLKIRRKIYELSIKISKLITSCYLIKTIIFDLKKMLN